MSTTTYKGIDYSTGRENRDSATGIRYGVISQNTVGEAWASDAESDYGKPHCPKCGNGVKPPEELETEHSEDEEGDFWCGTCAEWLDDAECFPDEPVGWFYNKEGYILTDCLQSDIFVIKSPFFSYGQFCSPCVPGACNLDSPLEEPDENNKCYCLGHDWFEGNKAPHRVYSVETGQEVLP